MLIGIFSFLFLCLGYCLGSGTILRQVKSGRIVIDGRIYLCKDTGPEVR